MGVLHSKVKKIKGIEKLDLYRIWLRLPICHFIGSDEDSLPGLLLRD
jgi:hypothetical protein